MRDATGATSVSFDVCSRALLIEGDADAAEKVIRHISNIDQTEEVRAKGACGSLCPVCFCPPDDKVAKLCCSNYCQDCFEMWITQASSAEGKFPFLCLNGDCQKAVPMTELSAQLEPSIFNRLLRVALDKHVNQNGDALQFCVTPDCPQVYQLGGARVVQCSSCQISICTACKVEEHEQLTCGEYQLAKAPPNVLRNKIVEDILTLKCPQCKKAFFDFEGCFALMCSNCKCGFCGWCLEDCGKDAHAHVRTCPSKPPGADMFFGSRKDFEKAQTKRQSKELHKFLSTLTDEDREKVLLSIKNDVLDLGIQI